MSKQDGLARRAVEEIRDALATLSYAADGHYEDEAQVALDALDWLEAHGLEAPIDPSRLAKDVGSP